MSTAMATLILYAMHTLSILLFLLGADLSLDPFYGQIPKNVPTFSIEVGNAEQQFVAFRSKEAWVNHRDELADWQGPQNIEIVVDSPWLPQPAGTVILSRTRYNPETSIRRKQRLEQGWKEAGYEFYGGVPVRKEELDYAKRAAEASRRLEASLTPPEETGSSDETVGSEQPAAPGLLQRRGAQAAIILAGLGLIAAVLRMLVFG